MFKPGDRVITCGMFSKREWVTVIKANNRTCEGKTKSGETRYAEVYMFARPSSLKQSAIDEANENEK